MSFCLCYREREQKCGSADSIGDSRCCMISQSTDPTKLPKSSFRQSCENVRRYPKKKAKKLCECSEHNSQRCGPDPAAPDQRFPKLKLQLVVVWYMCASLNFRAADLGCITSILNNNRSYGSDEISGRDAVAVLEKMFGDIYSYNFERLFIVLSN